MRHTDTQTHTDTHTRWKNERLRPLYPLPAPLRSQWQQQQNGGNRCSNGPPVTQSSSNFLPQVDTGLKICVLRLSRAIYLELNETKTTYTVKGHTRGTLKTLECKICTEPDGWWTSWRGCTHESIWNATGIRRGNRAGVKVERQLHPSAWFTLPNHPLSSPPPPLPSLAPSYSTLIPPFSKEHEGMALW